jgi:hypothetical protein
MNALNEVNKLIMSLNTIQRSTLNRSEESESLTAEKLIVRSKSSFPIEFILEFFLAMDTRKSSIGYRSTRLFTSTTIC